MKFRMTAEEKRNANGCGSSYWIVSWFRLPRFVSPTISSYCDCHDAMWKRQWPKETADRILYENIMRNSESSPWWQRWAKREFADIVKWALGTRLSQVCYAKAGVRR